MKINWKVRFRNPMFWIGIILAVVATVFAQLGVNFEQVTSWDMFFELLLEAVRSPVVIVAVITAAYNAVIDPTTSGFCDSKDAMKYDKPKEE